MKKLFFTALVAVVAIGGAFAGIAKPTVTVEAGILNGTTCTRTVNCSTDKEDACIIKIDDVNTQVYNKDASGNCTIFLGLD